MNSEARNLITEGIVSSVDEKNCTCRVTFPDKDNMVSGNLPVLGSFCNGNSIYALPAVGESVVCIFASNDDDSGTGFIIGARYDDKVKPKVADINKTRIDFKDGSYIEYDNSTSTMRIECKGDIIIKGRNIRLN